MTDDFYIVAITALLPLTAGILVLQVNPYSALVFRGILGAIAALVYALFGAADVALTEALVGTMLSITLYAVAVRSSMSMRLGVLENALPSSPLLLALSQVFKKHHMRVELVTYPNLLALTAALKEREIHAAYGSSEKNSDAFTIRIQRLYNIMRAELPPTTQLSYLNLGHLNSGHLDSNSKE